MKTKNPETDYVLWKWKKVIIYNLFLFAIFMVCYSADFFEFMILLFILSPVFGIVLILHFVGAVIKSFKNRVSPSSLHVFSLVFPWILFFAYNLYYSGYFFGDILLEANYKGDLEYSKIRLYSNKTGIVTHSNLFKNNNSLITNYRIIGDTLLFSKNIMINTDNKMIIKSDRIYFKLINDKDFKNEYYSFKITKSILTNSK